MDDSGLFQAFLLPKIDADWSYRQVLDVGSVCHGEVLLVHASAATPCPTHHPGSISSLPENEAGPWDEEPPFK